jgi:antitoxin ParD1/3/4
LAKFANLVGDHGLERDVPTRNINLTPEQDAFVEELVRSGRYQNASEALRDALRGLQQRWREDDLKLDILRMELQAGMDSLDQGRFTEISVEDLDGYLDRLSAPDDA